MAKIKLDAGIIDRAKKVAQAAGYSSVEEFVTHIIEKELAKIEATAPDETVTDRLRGLGYIE
jgi:hypothetical protein